MILSNYWKWLDGCFKIASHQDMYEVDLGLIATDGTPWAIGLGYAGESTVIDVNRLMGANLGFNLGSVASAITADMYAIDNDITSSFEDLTITYAGTATDEGLKRVFTLSARNKTANAVTINQVGITKSMKNANTNQNKNVMLAIFNLNEPLEVPANSNFSITVDWTEL